VGEVHATVPVLKEVRAQMPAVEIVLSTTTSSGQQAARDGAGGLYDHLVYFPMDIARYTLNAMVQVRPSAVLIMETELWLNFLWAAKVVKARTFLVNGRISDRSFRRAQRWRFFYRYLLSFVDRILMQSETDRERIIALGASADRVLVAGNTKFDQAMGEQPSESDARAEFGVPEGKQCVVVGSTRSIAEEKLVLNALKGIPDLYLILTPRHIERAEEVEAVMRECGLSPRRRSQPDSTGDSLLLDTFGELNRAYAACDIAIVGGGFEALGGQNIFQPLALGKPTLFGPHMTNFRDIAEMSLRAGVAFQASTADGLREQIIALLGDAERRRVVGERARSMIAENQGASKRIVAEVQPSIVST